MKKPKQMVIIVALVVLLSACAPVEPSVSNSDTENAQDSLDSSVSIPEPPSKETSSSAVELESSEQLESQPELEHQPDSSAEVSSQKIEFGSDGCPVHTGFYHAIDNRLIKYVGQDKMDKFIEKYGFEEDCNIVNFVKFCGITKEEFEGLIEEYDLNATAEYSGGNGYNAEVIFSDDQKKIDNYYGRSEK